MTTDFDSEYAHPWSGEGGTSPFPEFVKVSGDTMKGVLKLYRLPLDDDEAATKKYVDDATGATGGPFAPLTHYHPGVYEPANANIQDHITNQPGLHSEIDDQSFAADVVWSADKINTELDLKADISSIYTNLELDTMLDLKADQSTTYTMTEVDDALAQKAGLDTTYTKTEVDDALGLKSDNATTYTKSEVDALLGKSPQLVQTIDLAGQPLEGAMIPFEPGYDYQITGTNLEAENFDGEVSWDYTFLGFQVEMNGAVRTDSNYDYAYTVGGTDSNNVNVQGGEGTNRMIISYITWSVLSQFNCIVSAKNTDVNSHVSVNGTCNGWYQGEGFSTSTLASRYYTATNADVTGLKIVSSVNSVTMVQGQIKVYQLPN